MDLDAYKQLARNAYRKEYVANTPIGLREKAFLYPAATLLKGGLWIAGLGLLGMVFGVALAAPVFAAGMVAVAAGLPLLHTGSRLADRRAEQALERDIENGVLLEHFRRTMLPQPPVVAPESKVATLAAKEAFNAPTQPQPPFTPFRARVSVLRPATP
jgi:hypothetical protein